MREKDYFAASLIVCVLVISGGWYFYVRERAKPKAIKASEKAVERLESELKKIGVTRVTNEAFVYGLEPYARTNAQGQNVTNQP